MLDSLEIALARQPIFDRADRLVAYELLYRESVRTTAAAGADSTRMSSDTITRTLLGIGLERVTGGRRAFINVDRPMLLDGSIHVLDPQQVVIELLESVACDDETLPACEALVAAGYSLALDDYVHDPANVPLLRLARIVKIDVLGRTDEELRATLAHVRPYDVSCLAERVETAAARARCATLGFELFQGYFHARPELLAGREVPVQQGNLIRLMNVLRDPETSDAQVEEIFRGDITLAYKLLRIVNSAGTGRAGVESIGHAIRLLGRATLHRWLGLLLVSSFATATGVRAELVTGAMLRARFCELLGEAAGRRREGGALFMAGLFSLLDALMRVPMTEVVSRLELTAELRQALLAREGPYAAALRVAEAYETGAWDTVASSAEAFGVSLDVLPVLYVEALAWAQERAAEAASGEQAESGLAA